MNRSKLRTLVLLAALVAGAARVQAQTAHPDLANGPSQTVVVSGAVQKTLTLDVAALKALPPVTVTAGGHSYTGAALWPLLQSTIGIKSVMPKNPTVSMYLVAHGTDGYRVVIALAEIDPDFGNRPAIVAYALDGEPITKTGALRLVLPGDVKMARSVSNLDGIEVVAIRP